ncbi:MAG: hypothetical protein CL920_29370 [Deltaproteobacteria bacterium]|nr:hypothetical protein [Deltaproteobacteria bacterium]MBU52822.1 hypothetical protein [Deltaproteobacteria bacterium]|tara:strand:+ start:3558 stop:4466 length:909 start_codon:yes stop_codon:yes gene_type:complete
MLSRRSDGVLVKDSASLRKMIPFIMVGRNEAAVYFEQQLEVEEVLRYLKTKRESGEGPQITFFHVILCSLVRVFGARPELNRFVVGRRLYQRDGLEFSFAVKKSFRDDATMTTVKIRFEADDTIEKVAERIQEAIGVGRGTEQTTSEKEVSVLTRLPRFMLRLILWGQRLLDFYGLLPASLIKPDPMYASMFLANLGSIGLDAPFHHLFEYGTIPFFAVIGRIKKAPVVDQESGEMRVSDVVNIKYTFDERITDGFYCARSLALLESFFQDPSQLEQPPDPEALRERIKDAGLQRLRSKKSS